MEISTTPSPPKLKYGEKDIVDHVDIANTFNVFFTNIVKEYLLATVDNPFPHTHKNLKFL